MPRKKNPGPSAEARILTQIARIERVLTKVAQGQGVSKRDARAALKDLFDIKAYKNTPPPPRVVSTLRAWIEAEKPFRKHGRGPTLEEIAVHSSRTAPTIGRHRDTLAAHGCLTMLTSNPAHGGNWVSTQYARENIDEWEAAFDKTSEAYRARREEAEQKRRETRGTHHVRPLP